MVVCIRKTEAPKKVVQREGSFKMRKSITPGTVLILLMGSMKGKRVVCLKQLPSHTLLVTGPFKVNGVPIRRVNHRFVIATSTKVDISGVDVSKFDDAYFQKDGKKSGEQSILPKSRIADQDAVDNAILKTLDNDLSLKQYMKTRFGLHNGMRVHEMKF
eukprot:GHVO01028379.1.p1 GENE.GHVO01028379.1~~GHVO01028379.1.p1  ORF type:complete len:159 (-),score=15.05 GHVO01028379.1:172-648(-)